jgi:hypothetical protein
MIEDISMAIVVAEGKVNSCWSCGKADDVKESSRQQLGRKKEMRN